MQNYNDSANKSQLEHPMTTYAKNFDSGCWEDYMTPDEIEEHYERRLYEKSMRRTSW